MPHFGPEANYRLNKYKTKSNTTLLSSLDYSRKSQLKLNKEFEDTRRIQDINENLFQIKLKSGMWNIPKNNKNKTI